MATGDFERKHFMPGIQIDKSSYRYCYKSITFGTLMESISKTEIHKYLAYSDSYFFLS